MQIFCLFFCSFERSTSISEQLPPNPPLPNNSQLFTADSWNDIFMLSPKLKFEEIQIVYD